MPINVQHPEAELVTEGEVIGEVVARPLFNENVRLKQQLSDLKYCLSLASFVLVFGIIAFAIFYSDAKNREANAKNREEEYEKYLKASYLRTEQDKQQLRKDRASYEQKLQECEIKRDQLLEERSTKEHSTNTNRRLQSDVISLPISINKESIIGRFVMMFMHRDAENEIFR